MLYDALLKFLLNALFGYLMFACFLYQLKYRVGFAILSSLFLGLAGLRARDLVIPKVFMNPALDALGRAIVGPRPPAPKRLRRRRA